MRRPTFALFACSIVLAIGLQAQARQPQGETVPFAITHGPYLQLPSKTSMTIVWHTNRPAVSRSSSARQTSSAGARWPASTG